MDAVAIDPLSAVLDAGEGRFEWDGGSLLRLAPPSFEHGREMLFLASIMDIFAQERGLGKVAPDGYALHLGNTVRIPDVAVFRTESLHRVKPTHGEGGADLVVEIVSPESRGRDRGDKYYEYERAGVRRGVLDRRSHAAAGGVLPPSRRGLRAGVRRRGGEGPLFSLSGLLRARRVALEPTEDERRPARPRFAVAPLGTR